MRRTWTHPLYVYCPVHETALIPHANSPISVVSQLAIAGERAPARKYSSTPLSRFYFDDLRVINQMHEYLGLESGAIIPNRAGLYYAIIDIVDALATNMRTDGSGALVSMVERPMMKRRSLPGCNHLPSAWWSDVGASERLLYVRIALLFTQAKSPLVHWLPTPFGSSWFVNRLCAGDDAPWLKGAVLDPLILITMELPGHAIGTLNVLSSRWPHGLQQRWTYAVAAAGLGRHGRGLKSQPIAGYRVRNQFWPER